MDAQENDDGMKQWVGMLNGIDARKLQKLIGTVTFKYQRTTKEAKAAYHRAIQSHLLHMRKCKGYCALGHDSMTEWLESDFPQGRRHYERMLKNADFHIKLYGKPFVKAKPESKGVERLDEVYQIDEGVTRYITALPECAWLEVWETAKEIARTTSYTGQAAEYHSNKVTGRITSLAAKQWKEQDDPGVEPISTAVPDGRIPRRCPEELLRKIEAILDTENHIYLRYFISRAEFRLHALGKEDYVMSASDFLEEDDDGD